MNLYIPEGCKKIHVLFSGGADSTLLLYLLLLEKQRYKDLEIKCHGLNMHKSSIKLNRCKNILTVLEQKFHTVIDFNTFNKKFILRDFVKLLLSVDEGCVFSGCNKVLDFIEPNNYIEGDTPPVRGNPFNELHIRPFIEMDKSEIISYYIKYDILDLLKMTYSCGFSLEVPCGNCYFCLERSWGLQKCGVSI